MVEFIRIDRQLLNTAFNLDLRNSPSYTGPRLILRGVDPAALESAIRRHADQIVLAHPMVAEMSNEIPAAPEPIEALGLTGRLFALDAEHCQKNF